MKTRIEMLTSTRESDALCSRHVFQDLMAYTCTFNGTATTVHLDLVQLGLSLSNVSIYAHGDALSVTMSSIHRPILSNMWLLPILHLIGLSLMI